MSDGYERIWLEEPVRGGYPPPTVLGFSGYDSLRYAVETGGVRPPISHLTGMTLADVQPDEVTFTMPASPWFLSSQDVVSAGPLLMLIDGGLGCGVQIRLPEATPYTTAELSMTFLEPCPAGGTLRTIGRPLHVGKRLGLSAAWVVDGNGRPVAHGTSTCFVFDTIPGIERPTTVELPPAQSYDRPDPFERPAPDTTIPWEKWKTMTGAQILEAQLDGRLPPPPIHFLTGLTLVEFAAGRATFTMPATRWLTSPLGTVQGGAIAMLGHAALTTAVTSTLAAGEAYRPVDVKVNFLRPVHPGGTLTASGEVTHRGRTLAVARAEVSGADGKPVASLVGSTMITAER